MILMNTGQWTSVQLRSHTDAAVGLCVDIEAIRQRVAQGHYLVKADAIIHAVAESEGDP